MVFLRKMSKKLAKPIEWDAFRIKGSNKMKQTNPLYRVKNSTFTVKNTIAALWVIGFCVNVVVGQTISPPPLPSLGFDDESTNAENED